MAITVTTILGTDSLTASRPIINDNFNILKDEINSLESYIDPDAGTIDGLSSLQTTELYVGPITGYYMEINGSTFNINTPAVFTSTTSSITFNGRIAHDSFSVLDSGITGSTYTLDPATGRGNYSVIHTTTGSYTIVVNDGLPGQELTFFCENLSSGSIDIIQGSSTNFTLGGSNSTISLNDIGSTVTLRFMTDSSGNESWYIVGSYAVTLST